MKKILSGFSAEKFTTVAENPIIFRGRFSTVFENLFLKIISENYFKNFPDFVMPVLHDVFRRTDSHSIREEK